MARRVATEAIVLKTIDIGEADRLCVFFTPDRGRLAAKAKSVRKLSSKLGGTLLPFRHIALELSQSDAHSTVVSAIDKADLPDVTGSFGAFLRLQQGIELLLTLTEDDEPVPGIFDLLLQFIRLGCERADALLPFEFRLMHLLGFLPETDDDRRFAALGPETQAFVRACAKITDLSFLADMQLSVEELERFLRIVTDDQLQRPLKSREL